jgi:hypothetical protein
MESYRGLAILANHKAALDTAFVRGSALSCFVPRNSRAGGDLAPRISGGDAGTDLAFAERAVTQVAGTSTTSRWRPVSVGCGAAGGMGHLQRAAHAEQQSATRGNRCETRGWVKRVVVHIRLLCVICAPPSLMDADAEVELGRQLVDAVDLGRSAPSANLARLRSAAIRIEHDAAPRAWSPRRKNDRGFHHRRFFARSNHEDETPAQDSPTPSAVRRRCAATSPPRFARKSGRRCRALRSRPRPTRVIGPRVSSLVCRRLVLGATNDPLKEADRIADQVLEAPAHPPWRHNATTSSASHRRRTDGWTQCPGAWTALGGPSRPA